MAGMHGAIAVIAVVIGATAGPAWSEAARELLLPATATWQWRVVEGPRLAPQLGAMALAGLDVVAGRAAAGIDVVGAQVAPPVGWPWRVGDGAVAALPTLDPVAPAGRVVAAWGVAAFELGAGAQGLVMLELRMRFEDGVVVWLNGVEVVREALARGEGLAARPHGPEWQTFFVPVGPGLLRAGRNVVAVEVRPAGSRVRPRVEVEIRGRRVAGMVRGPLVADVDARGATVAVETDVEVGATLVWGQPARTLRSPPGRRHVFAIEGLRPGQVVPYVVEAGGERRRATLHALPQAGEVLRLGIYGDVRGGHAVHRQLVERMLGEGLDAVAVTGDMVLRGSDKADWQRFFAVTGELLAQLPYFVAVGNHDLGWDGASEARRDDVVFALPAGPPGRPAGCYWYSRALSDVHLVFLDSNSYARREQETWLAQDLAAARARGVRAILVFTHDGPYSRGNHGGNAIARERYVPILARYRVDWVFAGHDHLYQRGEIAGVRYVVTGGGGAPLYPVRCGVAGKRRCAVEDGMRTAERAYHYVVLTIARDIELCTRKVDGTLLEPCVRRPLRR